ncbi:coiled-coil domain-containing protein 40 isoform X2 [Cryptotermes secundus]|nr:coiled-coil domain-containing protein 40 isoform X2 [Cryptotermes secundus]
MKQQVLIGKYHETIANIAKIRQEKEAEVETCRSMYKSEQLKLNNAQKKEEELRAEMENLMRLEQQFADWEKEMKSEISVSERISEKTKAEERQLTKEMQKQDVFILKLMTEIANLEARLAILEGQLKLKESERNKVSQSIADANADLEALSREQQQLLQSWNSVFISIQQRDRVYMNVMQDYRKVQEEFQTLNNEIEGLKRASADEMLQNERLTIILKKNQSEEANLERLIALGKKKKENLEIQLSAVHKVLEQTDKEMQVVMLDYHKNSHEEKLLQKRVERLSKEKLALEDSILEKLQNQITQDKAAKCLNKVLQGLRNKTRDQEITMVNTENQLTQARLDVEHQKGMNEQTSILLEELKKQVESKENDLQSMESDLRHSMLEAHKKQGALDSLQKKLEELTSKSGVEDLSPQEMKIRDLERNITETAEKSEELQQFWLRQQAHTVQLANQRNEQLRNINLIRKQVLILDQKNLKIEHEIESHNKEEKAISRSIASLCNKLLSLNLKLCEKKDYKGTLDKENLSMQNHYMNILKDAELEAVLLQSEIRDLEQEKVQLGESLLEKQRELLAWEKKLQMAQETKQITQHERRKEGDVGAMKAEIHRMEVRYSQLRKAQEKLIGDLENCVSKRDTIVDQAETRKSHKGSHNTQHSFQKKLEDIRNRVKQVNSEIKSVEHQIQDVQQQHDQLIEQIQDKKNQMQQLQDVIKELDVKLEEGKLQHQKNLEVLVRRQRKARMYNDVKCGRHRLLFRSESPLDTEMLRQKAINGDLISVLESLLMDFPTLKFPLTKILNTLQLKPA